jgi:hypothetical protein
MSSGQRPAVDPQLDRAGRRLAKPSGALLAIAGVLLVIGVVLLIVGGSWVWILGVVFILLATIPGAAGFGLLGASTVARWAARRQPFA